MNAYEIVRATKVDPHRHVTLVCTSDGRRWTVDEARAAITAGDRFYTVSPSTQRAANVVLCDCRYCGFHKLRSAVDAASDSDLDALAAC